MNKHFYIKLAAGNIGRNSKTYLPYIIACVFTVAMFYIICMLSASSDIFFGHESLAAMLGFGNIVIGVFSVILLFYTNSFLIKRRQMEFGLYNVLGMGKRHIAKVISLETVYTALLSIGLGLGLGILLSKMIYLILGKLVNFNLPERIMVSPTAVLVTTALFSGIFLLTLLNSLRLIHVSKPIELLRGGNRGEKEPKTKWVLTILGLITLSAGYVMAVTIESPLSAFMMFFVAVILVIIGTYCLFTAMSIFFLKMLRRNRNYYYKTDHFISISGMMYRMKQNAVGLANICILATIVLVTLSTTISLYAGADDIVKSRCPYDINVTAAYSKETAAHTDNAISKVIEDSGHKVTAKKEYLYSRGFIEESAKGYKYSANITNDTHMGRYGMVALPQKDFNLLTGGDIRLKDNEVMIVTNQDTYTESSITIGDMTYSVSPLEKNVGDPVKKLNPVYVGTEVLPTMYVIVNDEAQLFRLQEANTTGTFGGMQKTYGFNISADDNQEIALSDEIEKLNVENESGDDMLTSESRASDMIDFYNIFGGLLFLGLYLGVIFLMATILIIYYKQQSEGYQDQERFRIMQNVGLTKKEVKKAIRSQVLTMFFMPIILACVHISFAFPMISKMLLLFNMTNTNLFILCMIGCAAIFAVFYVLVYALTSRMYYQIVEKV